MLLRNLAGCCRHAPHLLLALAIATRVVAQGEPVAPAPSSADETAVASTGMLDVIAAIVTRDLSLRPLPKHALTICTTPSCEIRRPAATSFEGKLRLDLPAGTYEITSTAPLEFEGREFSWTVPFTIEGGRTTTLELSNDNASLRELAPKVEPASDDGALFERVKSGVFTIESETGHGSGFLVDERGLVLTNHHVVRGSTYLAAKMESSLKYKAVLVAADELNDLAVLRVNPSTVTGRAVLPLAPDSPEVPAVRIGQPVIAIGSPLTSEGILTTGIVSKVEQGAILSDVNINHGNSGGPLLDRGGRVVGVNTFGLPTTDGPGVSGIVRIHLARAVVDRALAADGGASTPSAEPLPVASDYSFPPALLRSIASGETRKPPEYHLEAGPFDLQFVTPVLVSCLEMERERAISARHDKRARKAGAEPYEQGKDFYAWRRYTGDYSATVNIQVIPEMELTGGSILGMLFAGGNAYKEFKFKTDFVRMELVRDGRVVQPFFPGRLPHKEVAAVPGASIRDLTYYGAYEYPPEAFEPSGDVELRIWHVKEKQPRVRKLPPKLLETLWRDFEAYVAATRR